MFVHPRTFYFGNHVDEHECRRQGTRKSHRSTSEKENEKCFYKVQLPGMKLK